MNGYFSVSSLLTKRIPPRELENKYTPALDFARIGIDLHGRAHKDCVVTMDDRASLRLAAKSFKTVEAD